ncbi:MAG: hypothetical protein ACFFAO_18250 [Candidatus Hermodarchaeota archaeon]
MNFENLRKKSLLISIGGAVLGILVGLIEFTIGPSIRNLIGNKEDPLTLGIITMLLSSIIFFAGLYEYRSKESPKNVTIGILIAQLFPAVVCFTTVGLLWFIPGPVILFSIFLQSYIFWKGRDLDHDIERNNDPFQIMGWQLSRKSSKRLSITGSLLVILSIILGFISDIFCLYFLEVTKNSTTHSYSIVPIDIIKHVIIRGKSTKIELIENTYVMIIYIILLIGGSLSIIVSITASRLFAIIGGILVIFGLFLFIGLLPSILNSIGYGFQTDYNISTLGISWYMALLGGLCVIIGGLFINN